MLGGWRQHVVGCLAIVGTFGLTTTLRNGHVEAAEPRRELVRSTASGSWSAPATWEGQQLPGAGARVQIRAGHAVVYDAQSQEPIRFLHIAGTLSFARDRDTRLDVGLIKIQPGSDASEDGFDCELHMSRPTPRQTPSQPQPVLEVGSAEAPIPAEHTALIRLHYIPGMDQETCPAIVCCGGRMDFHGAALSRTWVKLGAPAKAGDQELALAEAVGGWRAGDRIIVTATTRQNKQKKTFRPSTRDSTQTEERVVRSIDGTRLGLDRPLVYDHLAEGDYRAELANLSRNVVVESADPRGVRGHTMYHRNSAGSIGYAEFRHLGKEGVLGKYSLHFHLVGDTMRGSSVIGASIWDSGNRWLTIHGTNYLVVRDCVGYQSVGHGFFLEDGSEVYNVLDRNLAVQAYQGKPLPKQIVSFDKNDGSGFWWANCHNTFTGNVACDCDEYGFYFQVAKTADFDPELAVMQPDGSYQKSDIRRLPFICFEDNEAHCQRRHGFNLGGGAPFGEPNIGGVGPDARHPFVVRNTKLWNVHWAFHPVAPALVVDGMTIHDADYDLWRAVFHQHAYRQVRIDGVTDRNHLFSAAGEPPREADYPRPLEPLDDLPPVTIVTQVERQSADKVVVRGTTTDNGNVKRVLVNGQPARALAANFSQWEVALEGVAGRELKVTAEAEDAVGNTEARPHVVAVALADETRPPAALKPGDKVVVIRQTELKAISGSTTGLTPGVTFTIEAIENNRLRVDAGRLGSIDASTVIAAAKADDYFSDILGKDPQDCVTWRARGRLRFDRGEHDRAIADLDECLRLRPDSLAQTIRGFAWKRKGDKPKAMTDLDAAIQLDPQNALAWRVRGATWAGKAEYQKAVAEYSESIRLDPENPDSLLHRAIMLAGCMDPAIRNGKQAVADATRACELSGWKNALYLNGLSMACSEAGDFDSAIRWATKASELMSKDQAKAVQDRIEQFRQHKPFRTTWR